MLACTDSTGERPSPSTALPVRPSAGDSAFAAVQARGGEARGMGVDQATSVHRFDLLPDGGRIELQRNDVSDSGGIAQIRTHLRGIVTAFEAGDFSTPAFVHMQQVPGAVTMAAQRAAIRYRYKDLPAGGEVQIRTSDSSAVRAVHAFVQFQRAEHRAGGADAHQHRE